MSGYRNGSESEGLGFNLCVALPHVVMSLILGDKGWVGDWRLELEMTSSFKTKASQEDIQVCKGVQALRRYQMYL